MTSHYSVANPKINPIDLASHALNYSVMLLYQLYKKLPEIRYIIQQTENKCSSLMQMNLHNIKSNAVFKRWSQQGVVPPPRRHQK